MGPRGLPLLGATIVPTIQLSPTFLALVVGVLGTTISPYIFFWQASEGVEELANGQVPAHHEQRPAASAPARQAP